MTINVLEEERVDDLGRMGYRIIQNKKKFCFGMDAVLLSWFAKTEENDRVLDMGTGTGIIPLLMKARARKAASTAASPAWKFRKIWPKWQKEAFG